MSDIETERALRSRRENNLMEKGRSKSCRATYINDGVRVWNKASESVKLCKTLHSAKKQINVMEGFDFGG